MVLAEVERRPNVSLLAEPLIFGSRKIHTQEQFDRISRNISHVLRMIEIRDLRNRAIARYDTTPRQEISEQSLNDYILAHLDILACTINPLD